MELEKVKRRAVRWESDEEWELELRAFHCNETWDFKDIRLLVSDLWFQYCEAKKIEIDIDELKESLEFFDKVKQSSQEEQIAVGTDHWNWLETAARKVVTEKEKIYE